MIALIFEIKHIPTRFLYISKYVKSQVNLVLGDALGIMAARAYQERNDSYVIIRELSLKCYGRCLEGVILFYINIKNLRIRLCLKNLWVNHLLEWNSG